MRPTAVPTGTTGPAGPAGTTADPPGPGAVRASRLDRVVGVLAVAAGVAYSIFLLTPLLGPTLDPARSYVSELAARDQPTAPLFRLTDAVVGVVLVITGAYLARRTGRRAARGAGAALALFGAATLLDVAYPMACAPSADPVCAAQELARTAAEFGVHEVAGVLANLAAAVAVALLAVARSHRRAAGRLPAPAEAVFLTGFVLVAVTGVAVVVHETLGTALGPWIGYVQRVQVLALSAVVVTVGVLVVGGSERTR